MGSFALSASCVAAVDFGYAIIELKRQYIYSIFGKDFCAILCDKRNMEQTMTMDDFRRWLQDGLDRVGKTQSDLARHVGKPANYINKIFSENRKIGLEEYVEFAKFVGEPAIRIPILIRGKVGAGGHVHGLDAGVIGEVENTGDYPIDTSALEVEGDSMGEMIPDGSVIFYDTVYEYPQDLHINNICVVWRADGKVMVKRLLRGTRKDRWSLYSINGGAVEEDVFIDYVAKVTGVKFR
ncbi:LexA family transcriptional regulator [Agrobacterium burrii]|uniref:Peptidase S24/S26A/S26B/S26C domain-containing protein n=2 Tax=Agrobacterium TaxID=357 RepID=A0ABS3EB09_9HYPH|nr:S24 family peptidase [Agrobacterium burrii]MBO0129130.1 hypothetical protein [Agrobacterium burrii]